MFSLESLSLLSGLKCQYARHTTVVVDGMWLFIRVHQRLRVHIGINVTSLHEEGRLGVQRLLGIKIA